MSSTFTPSNVVDMSKERDWAARLGMLDWDSTNIVFTKRSLIEFLKYTGTTVDTNFSNISKLPRYAKFGKLTSVSEDDNNLTTAEQAREGKENTLSNDLSSFKPSRRVRTAPGGVTHNIFDHDEGEDALSSAPHEEVSTARVGAPPVEEREEGNVANPSSSFKPSRRVRTQPGGQTSLAGLWDTGETTEEFKPTRRVREGPGGKDHINNIF